jgi:hypothetical protein
MYSIKSTVTSEVTSPGVRIKAPGGNALILALKTSQQLYGASRLNSKYKPILTSLAKKLNSQVEKAFVDALGGSQIVAKTGIGFQPDYYIQIDDKIEVREQKLVSTTENNDQIFRNKAVKLAGGEGILLSSGSQSFLQAYSLDEKGNIVKNIVTAPTTYLFNKLVSAKSSEEIKNILSTSGKANTYLRNNIMLKAQNIDIPVVFRGVLENRTIKFTWNDIVKNKYITIKVNKLDNNTLSLQVSFSAATITKALNDVQKIIIREINGELGITILKAIADIFTLPNSVTAKELADWLKENGFEHGISYLVGSAIISKGNIRFTSSDKPVKRKITTVKTISDIQMSVLIRKKTEQIMPHGPLRGPPLSPTVLTYRTGQFVESLNVIQDFRNQIIRYYYSPNYLAHETTRRAPRFLLQKSIREVVQQEYGVKFKIIRGF